MKKRKHYFYNKKNPPPKDVEKGGENMNINPNDFPTGKKQSTNQTQTNPPTSTVSPITTTDQLPETVTIPTIQLAQHAAEVAEKERRLAELEQQLSSTFKIDWKWLLGISIGVLILGFFVFRAIKNKVAGAGSTSGTAPSSSSSSGGSWIDLSV